ncbi:unnamed protein product [Angiostrongylus costaricensis]|uniref:BRCT domain-containing protein n=1 Tax=Angiostrongylus costaricensis TaxID=334426 RepID=A0A158PEG1_ANGCS|nr:unnamed protein product [Angiostrongylus costaricensis]
MSKENRTRKKTIVSLGSSVVKKKDWLVVLQDIGIRIKPFSSRTKYLVASSVQDAHYRRAIALGIYVVNEEFLQRCSELEFHDDIANVAEICRLQIFAGLTISFVGISDQKVEDYTRSVVDNAGRVSSSTMNSTHVIVASGQPPSASCYGKNLVTMEWFHESMDLGWCANEQCFKYRRLEPSRLQPSTSFLMFQRRRRVENSAMKYKRYQLCLELFKTEINCLKTSDFLVRNAHVSAEANDIMFGVFGGMRQAHDGIVRRMGEVLDTWNDHSTIGDIFVEGASSLKDAYFPYFHTLETSLQYIKEYRKQNAKFNSFIMEKERDRSVGKQKLEYLLNVPFQQITSRIPVSLKDEENILVIVVRNHSKDAEWYLQILHSVDSTNEFAKKLVGEVFQATGRRISIDEGCLSELDEATLNESRFSSATSKVLRWVSLRKSRYVNRSITTAAAAFERNDVEKAPKA